MNMPTDDDRKRLEDELREPLSGWLVKPVASADTAALIRKLQPAFDELRARGDEAPEQAGDVGSGLQHRPSLPRMMLAQLASYPKGYWVASAAVFVMLALILSSYSPPYDGLADLFTLFTPAVLLAGLLYSFRAWNKGMRTIESVTPYPPALLLLCRFLIVIGLNVLLGVSATVYLSVSMESFPFLPFLIRWFSLMLLTGGMMAFVMLHKGIKAGMTAALLVWLVWQGSGMALADGPPTDERLTIAGHTAALALGIALLTLAYRRSLGIRLLK
ncbi:MAG TPA: hypothetical protein VMS09_07260 [Paenibacillus sp.]|uniref:hypothetical protein n=1 Tax=Paenibacillus sp. TaxID=58172 RepID=UPI0028D3DDCE|nr:hypothetical protein [Paenibacillus sp.]HUC91809.1 hypothetical protein [Paenibacillus sp.]